MASCSVVSQPSELMDGRVTACDFVFLYDEN